LLAFAVPVLALMGFSLVYGGWHSVADVIGGLMLGAAVAAPAFLLRRR
jgi:membrane-associated phospholipid phosphatase